METWREGCPANYGNAEGSPSTRPEDSWVATKQEEDKLKTERRKHSKKESAMRCKKRRQEELVKLQIAVEELKAEKSALARKLYELAVECERLNSENSSIMDELREMYGPDAISEITTIFADYSGLVIDSNSEL